MEAKVRDATTGGDQLQLPGLDAHAQVSGLASGEGASVDDSASPGNRVLWKLVLHPVENAVVHGGCRRTADVRGRHSVGCRHRPQSRTVLPGLNRSGQ